MEPGFPVNAPWHGQPPAPVAVFHGLMVGLILFQIIGTVWMRRRPATVENARSWVFGVNLGMGAIGILRVIAWGYDARLVYEVPAFGFLWCYFGLYWLLEWIVVATCYSRVPKRPWLRLERFVVTLGTVLGMPLFVLALSLPYFDTGRGEARRDRCAHNLKSIVMAAINLKDRHSGEWLKSQTGEPPMSWRVAFLPELDMAAVRRRYDATLGWDSPENTSLAQERLGAYMCPSVWGDNSDSQKRFFTQYVMLTGPGTVSPQDGTVHDSDIADGSSHTAVFVEAAGRQIVWTEPRDAELPQTPITINQRGQGQSDSPSLLSSYHARGAFIALADGSVRFVSNDIDPAVLKGLTTINDGRASPLRILSSPRRGLGN